MTGQPDGSIIIDTELDPQGFDAGSKELESAISSFEKTISKIGQSLNSLGPTFTRALQGSESAIASFDSKIGQIDESLSKAREEIAAMESQLQELANAQVPTEQYQQLSDKVDSTCTKLDALVEKQKQLVQSDSNGYITKYQELQDQITATEAKLEELRALQSEMQASPGDYGSADFARVRDEITSTEVDLAGLNLQMRELESSSGASAKIAQYQSLQSQIEQLITVTDEAVEKLAAMEQDGTAFQMGSATSKYAELQAELSRLKEEYDKAASAADRMRSGAASAGSQASSAASKTSRFASAAKVLKATLSKTGQVARSAFSKVASCISSAASSMKRLITNTKSSKNQFSGLISSAKKFTLSLLGARGVYALLRKAVSAYMDENEELSNTLSSCWTGIGNLLGPIITKLINLVAQATAYVTKFLNLFGVFGKSVSKSVSKAASDTEKLKRTLASFDELNVLSDKNSDKDNGDNSDNNTSLPDVTLPDWAKEIANQIKAGDWAGAATTLANKLNDMVDSVDWAGLGTKVGKLIHGVLSFLATFIKTFNWQNLGAKLGTFLTNLIKNVNWSNLGVLLVAKWKILLELLVGFFENFDGKAFGNAIHQLFTGMITACDWVGLSKRLGKAISKVITDINWKQLGTDVGTLFRTALQSISAFVSSVNWKGIGESVADFINGIDWKGIFDDLSTLIGKLFVGALDLLSGFLGKVDWKKLAKSIGDWFKDLPKKINWSTFGKKLGECLNNAIQGVLTFAVTLQDYNWEEISSGLVDGLIDMFTNAIKNISWEKVIGLWVTAISQFVLRTVTAPFTRAGYLFGAISKIIGQFFESIGLDGIAGFFKGIGDALSNVGTWIKEHIIDPIVGWVKKLFGIHSPSTVFAEIGGWLIQGLLNGIKAVWTKIKDFFSTAFGALKTFISNAWKGIATVTSTIWNGIKTAITNVWTGIKTVWSGAKNFFSGIWSGIKSAFGPVKDWIKNAFSGAWNGVKSTWTGAKNFFSGIWSGIKSAFGSVTEWFRNTFSKAWQAVKNVFSTGGKVFEGIKDGIVTAFKTVVNAIIRGINKVIALPFNAINGILDNIRSVNIFGIEPFSWIGRLDVPQIPELYRGGVLKKGQVGFLEGNGDEAVVPLDRNTGWIAKVAEKLAKYLSGNNAPAADWQTLASAIIDGLSQIAQTMLTGIARIAEQSIAGIEKIVVDANGVMYDFTPLYDIAHILANSTNMLTSAGELRVPQIATGSVMPINNRAETYKAEAGYTAQSAEAWNDVDEHLYDIESLLSTLIAIVKALHLNIDINALTEMITKQQRANARNYGGAI